MRKVILIIAVVLQFATIAYLFNLIQKKRNEQVLGRYALNPIKKENIIYPDNEQSSLKHFYEPAPNATTVDKPEWLGYEAIYTINSDSLNERYDYSIEKPEDTFRVITLGDSFTFGHFVNTQDNYSEKLEVLLNTNCAFYDKYEVINLGERGYDVQYTVERFKRRGIKYNPDLVTWLILPNDFSFFNEMIMARVKEIYDEATSSGTIEQRIKSEGQYFNWIQANYELGQNLGKEQIIKYQENNFSEFRKSYAGKLILMVFSEDIRSIEFYSIIKSQLEKPDTYLFSDLKHKDLETLKKDFHPSAGDHLLIAGKLFNYLLNNQLIPCN